MVFPKSDTAIEVAVAAPALLGESPLWHPQEQVLYYCDIPGHALLRFDPATGEHARWAFETDVGCCAAHVDGSLLLAMRDGLWRFDPRTGERQLRAAPPYDPATERFNDGKCDPQGRFWVSTIYEPRDRAAAALFCLNAQGLVRRAEGATVGNGLAWSPDGGTLYWSDTKAHVVRAFDFDRETGALSRQRDWLQFEARADGQALDAYGGRPDGAAVDSEGHYWVAMFEGGRVLRVSPQGQVVREVRLPVRCPTMPCFGGPDLKTLYITTAHHNRPADELRDQPLAGGVLSLRVEVPGLPASLVNH
jgi:sugar lactone lactonase YvrE